MADIARWSAVDPMAEENPGLTPYRYGFNNPVMFTDPNGMLEQALIDGMMSQSGTWYNTGMGFTNSSTMSSLDYDGNSINWSNDFSSSLLAGVGISGGGGGAGSDGLTTINIPEIIMRARGNEHNWNMSINKSYNDYLRMSLITGVLGEWNFQQNRAFYYNEVARTGAEKIERNFYLMFGGMLAAPFAMSYIATLGGETAAGYLQGTAIRGVTDMALQQTIKGSIDWKQTGINAFIGGGQGLGATQVNWLNYGGNMINNFGTSYYDGGKKGFIQDFGINGMKALTGIFGMGVANYNGLTNGYLSGYFGTTLFPGIYFNTTDIVIEKR